MYCPLKDWLLPLLLPVVMLLPPPLLSLLLLPDSLPLSACRVPCTRI
jgi:hypothetical protein